VVIVNVRFHRTAKKESIDTLRDRPRPSARDALIAQAAPRSGTAWRSQQVGIDGILGTRRWMDIIALVRDLRRGTSGSTLSHSDRGAHVRTDGPGRFAKRRRRLRVSEVPMAAGVTCVLRHSLIRHCCQPSAAHLQEAPQAETLVSANWC
jgi:hypothetical protein